MPSKNWRGALWLQKTVGALNTAQLENLRLSLRTYCTRGSRGRLLLQRLLSKQPAKQTNVHAKMEPLPKILKSRAVRNR